MDGHSLATARPARGLTRPWPEVTSGNEIAVLEFNESNPVVLGSFVTKFIPPKGFEETMKIARHCALLAFLIALCAAASFADEPGRHPAYLHALTDLRHARAHLQNPSPTYHMDKEEEHAINEIDKAIEEIKRAAIDDGKNLNDHPPVDSRMDRAGRFHRAMELLDKAHNDIAREEDDPSVRGLRNRAIHHIDEAHRIVDHLIVQAANY
jgi:hypothetical protein